MKATGKLKKLYTALKNACIAKAEKENNWFVLLQITSIDISNISTSDVDIMNEYLFDGVPHWYDLKTGQFYPK